MRTMWFEMRDASGGNWTEVNTRSKTLEWISKRAWIRVNHTALLHNMRNRSVATAHLVNYVLPAKDMNISRKAREGIN